MKMMGDLMKIENQAMMFAFFSKHAIQAEGEKGREVIQEGMKRYGRERGARMAARARANGDPVDLLTEDELRMAADKKAELGGSAMKDFTYHTAHIYYSVADEIRKGLPEKAEEIISGAVADYVELYGHEDYDALLDYADEKF